MERLCTLTRRLDPLVEIPEDDQAGCRQQWHMNKRISIHHVGGRGGGGQFPLQSRFQRDLVLTFYEADADALEQIKERNRYLKSEDHVLPYCLGPGSGETTLYINYDPYTSSLLPPNPFYRDYRCISNYGFGKDYDYVLGEVM